LDNTINYYIIKDGIWTNDFSIIDLYGENIYISYFSTLKQADIKWLSRPYLFLNITTSLKELK
jgi:hypothetical protein